MALVVKNPPANAGDIRDAGLIPGSGRSPGGEHGNPFQYSCLESLMDRGAWWGLVHRVTKSWRQLKQLSIHACKIDKPMGICCMMQGTQSHCSVTTQRGGMGREVEGRFKREEIYVHLWPIYVDVWQKLS